MLIDMHAHSSGISPCCRIPYSQTLHRALQYGMDGVVLTNHYQKSYTREVGLDAFVEKYIAEYEAARKYGAEIGCRVFFGVEVTMERYPNVHMLLYGVGPEFLRDNPGLFDCTQKELYQLVKANGGLLIQAHPFRNGATVLDTALLDGVEINCHPLYGKSYAAELLQIARREGLMVTCGGDYHADTYRPKCGMLLPEGVEDHWDLRDCLLSDAERKLCIQEPNCDAVEVISVKAYHHG